MNVDFGKSLIDYNYQIGNITIMETIKYWRTAKGYSLDEAGALIGVSGVQWHRYETGTRKVSALKVMQMEALTGIPCHLLRPDMFCHSHNKDRAA